MSDDTRVDVLLNRIKNDRYLSLLLVLGIAFLAIVSVANGLQQAGSILGKALSTASTTAQYDAATAEALIAVAHDVDVFVLRIESAGGRTRFADVDSAYIAIEASLRSVRLRNQVRPLNEISTRQVDLMLQNWEAVGRMLRQPTGASHAAITQVGQLVRLGFEAILTLEVRKPKAAASP